MHLYKKKIMYNIIAIKKNLIAVISYVQNSVCFIPITKNNNHLISTVVAE